MNKDNQPAYVANDDLNDENASYSLAISGDVSTLDTRINEEVTIERSNHPSVPVEENCFYQEGDVWKVSYEGKSTSIKHSKGMTYISYLLEHPNKIITALELQMLENNDASALADIKTDGDISLSSKEDEKGVAQGSEKKTEAQQNYEDFDKLKHKIQEMKRGLDKMDESDPGYRLEKSQYEDALQLFKKNYGRRGQKIDINTNNERARSAVTRNINTARDRIKKNIPELFLHLQDIKTGTSIVYRPQESIKWHTSSSQ